ncbi:hypothetical protein M9H77_22132 [Catharanthus roseus]|uniref:Uncharacterized protein n=1 Tax=Catharanthus roseus TaxID=4058 RepID=A0ACC0AQJ0_CATRO|nr:hypothetical protein M9H77_22132 [Catharanthus roseus]
MEEVPVHVHPGCTVLIFYRDSTNTDLVKKEPLEAWILRPFTGSETDDDLIMCAHGFIFLFIGGLEHTCLVQIEQNKHRNLSSKFISMFISRLVANDPEIPVSNIIQEVQVLFQTSCTYKRAWYA